MDTLREQAKLDDIPDPEISDSARKQAPTATSLLSVSQIASYVAANEDDVSDPLEEMMDALDQLADKPGAEEYASIRAELLSDIPPLVVGLDKSAQKQIASKLGEWLDGAHAVNPSKLQSDHRHLRHHRLHHHRHHHHHKLKVTPGSPGSIGVTTGTTRTK